MSEPEKIAVLDHGYMALVETWGSDERIIEAARMKLMVWESGNVVDDGGWCLLQWSRAAESALRSRGEAP